MSATCSCDVSFSNTGKPNCVPLMSVARKIIVVPIYNNSGVKNSIDLTSTLNASYFNALKNNADRSQRWYPLPKHKNAASTKADSVLQSFEDGSAIFVREGVRSWECILPSETTTMLGKLKGGRCTDFGIYIVDANGALIGYTNGESGVLYPIPVNKSTWNPIFNMATDTTVPTINLKFEFDIDLFDEYLQMITTANITGINLLTGFDGLYDIHSTVVSCHQTATVLNLYTEYGDAKTPVVDSGLVAADFAIYNVTGSAAVTVSTCTESPNGTYTLTYSSQTIGNVLRFTPSKSGRDYTAVIANTGTVS